MPLISILMPLYNAAATCDDALRALAAQSLRDFEVVAVDDGSTDATRAILAAWAQTDPRVRPVPMPHRGLIAALNHGLQRCSGEYIARMDADDRCHPERLQRQAALLASEAGSRVEIVSPERYFAPELGALTQAPYAEHFLTHGVRMTIMTRVSHIVREGNKLKVTLSSDYAPGAAIDERLVDQVVIEHATLPNADLYFELKEESVNRGEVDHDALIDNRPQAIRSNPNGTFQLFRIGDAVASRNIHAAIYEALRMVRVM